MNCQTSNGRIKSLLHSFPTSHPRGVSPFYARGPDVWFTCHNPIQE